MAIRLITMHFNGGAPGSTDAIFSNDDEPGMMLTVTRVKAEMLT